MRREWKGTGMKPVVVPGIQTLLHKVIITLILTAFSLSAFLRRVPFNRGDKPTAPCCRICHMQISAFLAFQEQHPRPDFPAWVFMCVAFGLTWFDQLAFLPGLSVVLQFLLRFHPITRQTNPSKQFLLTSVLLLGLVGWKELIWLTFSPPSQSPDSKRSFWSVSVLTSSQLALDMSMSSPVWSC